MMLRSVNPGMLRLAAMTVGVALMGLLLGGCGGKSYGAHEIVISLSESLNNQTVDVDVIGVTNDQNKEMWSTRDVATYFSAADTNRKAALASGNVQALRFSSGASGPKTITIQDPLWNGPWHGATALVVMANIFKVDPDAKDARRVVIPLENGLWDGKRVEVKIGSRVEITTKQNTPKS